MKPRNLLPIAAGFAGVFLGSCGSVGDGGGESGESLPTVTAEMDLRVGSVDDPEYSLTTIGDLEVDETGRMFTLHGQEQIVRVFSPDGAHEQDLGGPGSGPGEFERPLTMGWIADTLWVMDLSTYSFSLFDREGAFLREFAVPLDLAAEQGGARPPRSVRLLHDGRIYGEPAAGSRLIVTGELTEREGFVLDESGAITDSILPPIPYGRATLGVSIPDRPTAMMFGSQRFGDSPLLAFVPGEDARIVVDRALPDGAVEPRYAVSKVSFSGDTVLTFERSPPPVTISQAEVDDALNAWVEPLGDFSGMAPAAARDLVRESLYLPVIRPGASSLLVSRNGEIWIEETTPDSLASWLVLSPEGQPAFRVDLPDEVVVMVVGETHAWGSLEDELEVPYLVRYRFERP